MERVTIEPVSYTYNFEVLSPIPIVEDTQDSVFMPHLIACNYAESCSSLHEFIPEVEVTVAPQPVPSMEEVDGHVYDMISSIASLMKPEAEKKLGRYFTDFQPVYYMKKGSISYCLKVSGLV